MLEGKALATYIKKLFCDCFSVGGIKLFKVCRFFMIPFLNSL